MLSHTGRKRANDWYLHTHTCFVSSSLSPPALRRMQICGGGFRSSRQNHLTGHNEKSSCAVAITSSSAWEQGTAAEPWVHNQGPPDQRTPGGTTILNRGRGAPETGVCVCVCVCCEGLRGVNKGACANRGREKRSTMCLGQCCSAKYARYGCVRSHAGPLFLVGLEREDRGYTERACGRAVFRLYPSQQDPRRTQLHSYCGYTSCPQGQQGTVSHQTLGVNSPLLSLSGREMAARERVGSGKCTKK